MKDWFRDDDDRLLPLMEGRNIAEQHYNSDKSPDKSDKWTAAAGYPRSEGEMIGETDTIVGRDE